MSRSTDYMTIYNNLFFITQSLKLWIEDFYIFFLIDEDFYVVALSDFF